MPGDGGHDLTIVDACTRRGGGGSPTAVLIDHGALSDGARRAIVRRAGTSHAAFVDTGADTTPTVLHRVRRAHQLRARHHSRAGRPFAPSPGW
jgi:hypothetical protein